VKLPGPMGPGDERPQGAVFPLIFGGPRRRRKVGRGNQRIHPADENAAAFCRRVLSPALPPFSPAPTKR